MTKQDEDAQRKAEQAEGRLRATWMTGVRSNRKRGARARGTSHGVSSTAGQASRTRILFECRMLQKSVLEGGERRWQTMSCQDEDDFAALKQQRWAVDVFAKKTKVVLLRADAEAPANKDHGFVRLATVERSGMRL